MIERQALIIDIEQMLAKMDVNRVPDMDPLDRFELVALLAMSDQYTFDMEKLNDRPIAAATNVGEIADLLLLCVAS